GDIADPRVQVVTDYLRLDALALQGRLPDVRLERVGGRGEADDVMRIFVSHDACPRKSSSRFALLAFVSWSKKHDSRLLHLISICIFRLHDFFAPEDVSVSRIRAVGCLLPAGSAAGPGGRE